MSVLAFAAIGAALGAAVTVGYALGRFHEHESREQYVEVCLEEGFRTFIEHHVEDIERDSETADKLWEQTVQHKAQERLAREFAEN
jgi:L-2-hydroxyglutarate oxidase LhgO